MRSWPSYGPCPGGLYLKYCVCVITNATDLDSDVPLRSVAGAMTQTQCLRYGPSGHGPRIGRLRTSFLLCRVKPRGS